MSASELLRVQDVMRELQCGRSTVYDLIKARELPTVDIGLGAVRTQTRIPAAGLAAFIARRTTPAKKRAAHVT